MIDKKYIGARLRPHTVEVEKEKLRDFARATGQSDPVYLDEGAARDAGHRALPVPPTFLFCLEMASPHAMEVYELLDIDYSRVLHGEQYFTYHQLVFAGDTLTFERRIADIYTKKAGALEFIVWESRVEAGNGRHVADLRSVMVVRNDEQKGTA